MIKNNLKLNAELSKEYLTVFLEKDGKIIAKAKIANDNHLSQKTLPFLDKFLKKAGYSVKEISDTELKSELPDTFTSYRIAKVILETIKWENTNHRT